MNDLQRLALILKKDKLRIPDIATRMRINEDAVYNLLDRMETEGYDLRQQAVKRGRKDTTWYWLKSVEDEGQSIIISGKSRKTQQYKLGLITDTHFGDKHLDKQGLEGVLDRAWDQGVRHLYHAGDVVTGYGVYSGQLNDLEFWTEQEQVDQAANFLGKHEWDIYAIHGNHDANYCKSGSPNPVKMLSGILPNFHYLGGCSGNVIIGGVRMYLLHGRGGGNAYDEN